MNQRITTAAITLFTLVTLLIFRTQRPAVNKNRNDVAKVSIKFSKRPSIMRTNLFLWTSASKTLERMQ